MKSILLVLLFALPVFPQGISIVGKIADSTNNSALSKANIILIHLPDSSISGTASNSRGYFRLEDVKPGKYLFKVSYIGYKSYVLPLDVKRSMDLQTILLSPGQTRIQDVEVIGKTPPVIQNADTTEFNADAFKTHKDANAEDLVGKMPGVTVTDGKVKTQGEEVKRVLVDGRTFFGDDPTAVLRNLPAEIIEKIQVFDEQSEQSRFTGFEDGNTSKTMNVVTRMRIRQGTFGRFSGGMGDDKRYSLAASINFFNDDQRISLLGQLNNINEQNFSREDLMGVFSSNRRGGPGGPMMFDSRGPGGGMPGGSFGRGGPDFLVNIMNGLSTTKALGINYSDKFWNSLNLSGSYFVNWTDNSASSNVRRQYLLPELAGQIYSEENTSSSNNVNHRFNMRMEYQIDTLNDISFRPRLSLQQNSGSARSIGETTSLIDLLNSIRDLSGSDITAINSSAEFLYRHRFETKGRTFSIALNGNYTKNDGTSSLYAENIYYNMLQHQLSDTLDQNADLYRWGRGISSNIMYTEPIGENSMIQFTSGLSFSKEFSDQKRFDITGPGNMLDTSLTNLADKHYTTQTFGTGYRYQADHSMSFNANISYNISRLNNAQTFPYLASMEKKFTAFLPSMMMRYDISRDKNLHFFYRTNNNDPGISQLQDVLDNSNPLQLSIGNPDLKQDYRHSFLLRYSQMDVQSYNAMFIMLNATFTNDYIGNKTIVAGRDTVVYKGIVLSPGTQLTTPSNLDGYFNLGSSIVYSLPFDLIMSMVNMNLDISYSRIPGTINNQTGYSNSNNYTLGLVLTSNISPELDFTFSGSGTYNFVNSSLRKNYNDKYNTYNGGFKMRFQFLENFVFNNSLNYSYDNGLSADYNRDMFLWNLSLGYKFLANNQAEVRISAYDILNKNTNVQRVTGDSYIQDTRSNTIGRYFILSFIYQLRNFGG